MKIAVDCRSAMAQEMIAKMAAGTAASPVLEIYSGAMPAAIGGVIIGDLLTEHQLTNQVATENDGVITFDAIGEDLSVNTTGDAGWARILNRDAAEALYLTVSETGAGGELQLNTTALQQGSSVTITSGVISVGA